MKVLRFDMIANNSRIYWWSYFNFVYNWRVFVKARNVYPTWPLKLDFYNDISLYNTPLSYTWREAGRRNIASNYKFQSCVHIIIIMTDWLIDKTTESTVIRKIYKFFMNVCVLHGYVQLKVYSRHACLCSPAAQSYFYSPLCKIFVCR